MDALVEEYFILSEQLRRGYLESLGTANPAWREMLAEAAGGAVPETLEAIYSRVSGTRREVSDQRMDFIPGYRLIHVEELTAERQTLLGLLGTDDIREAGIEAVVPLLSNDSSCRYFWARTRNGEEPVFHYAPEDGVQKVHASLEAFFRTGVECYQSGAYFLDQNGFLDVDFEKEGRIGARQNPGIAYWTE